MRQWNTVNRPEASMKTAIYVLGTVTEHSTVIALIFESRFIFIASQKAHF